MWVSGCWRTAARSLWSALETFQLVLTEFVMDDGCVECARGALLLWSISLINWPIRSEDLRLSVTTTWHFRRSIRNYPHHGAPCANHKRKNDSKTKKRGSFLRTQAWSCARNFHFSLCSPVRARAWTFSRPNGSQHLYLFWLLSHLITEPESFLGAHVSLDGRNGGRGW